MYSDIINSFLCSFNNREIASIIWFSIAFITFSFSKSVRGSFRQVLKAFFEWKLLLILTCLSIYVVIEFVFLHYLRLWDLTLLKDAVAWFLFSSVSLLINTATLDSKEQPIEQYLRKVILDNLRIVLILEFIINLYTFNLIVEFICIGLITFFALIGVVAGTDDKYQAVKKLSDGIVSMYGLVVLIFTLVSIIKDYHGFIALDNLRSFFLPIMLMFMFIPFLYFTSLAFIYERLFLRLEFILEKNYALIRFAKKQIFRLCFLNLKTLSRFNDKGVNQLLYAKSKEDILREIDEFRIHFKIKKEKGEVHLPHK